MRHDNPWDVNFTTNERQVDSFLSRVLVVVNSELGDRPLRVLDVGCGNGGKVLRLAEHWPQAQLTGVDISEPCIRDAERLRQASPLRERIEFLRADYLNQALGQYDLILADSVLHLIPGSTYQLFAKLAGELNSGGLLLFTMPYSCAYNTLLALVRRTLRLFRSRLTDRLVLALADLAHGRAYSPEFLRERLHYAYYLPCRMGCRSLEKALLTQHHLALRQVVSYPHTSLGQHKHRLWCFRNQPPTLAVPRQPAWTTRGKIPPAA